MKIKTPKQYCDDYILSVYDGPLAKKQTVEVSQAFHAGIEAAFKFIDEYMDDQDEETLMKIIISFRKINKAQGLDISLSQHADQ